MLLGGHGLGPGILVTLLEIVLIYGYRYNFAGIFSFKANPTA